MGVIKLVAKELRRKIKNNNVKLLGIKFPHRSSPMTSVRRFQLYPLKYFHLCLALVWRIGNLP